MEGGKGVSEILCVSLTVMGFFPIILFSQVICVSLTGTSKPTAPNVLDLLENKQKHRL